MSLNVRKSASNELSPYERSATRPRPAKVIALMSMSLDGFVAGPDDGVNEVFDWYFSGDEEVPMGGLDPMTFRMSPASAGHLRGVIAELGAMLTGRRTFEKT